MEENGVIIGANRATRRLQATTGQTVAAAIPPVRPPTPLKIAGHGVLFMSASIWIKAFQRSRQ